jgi:hypothetical protein
MIKGEKWVMGGKAPAPIFFKKSPAFNTTIITKEYTLLILPHQYETPWH